MRATRSTARHHHFGWDNRLPTGRRRWRPATTHRVRVHRRLRRAAHAEEHASPTSRRSTSRKVNPVTGPVYVDGAEPGDALKVTIDEFTPVRLRLDGEHSGLRAARRPVQGAGAAHLELRHRGAWRRPLFGRAARVPLKPFCRHDRRWRRPSRACTRVVPPRRVGGNLDIRDLVRRHRCSICRSRSRARCSRSATRMPRRATARSAARRSKAR